MAWFITQSLIMLVLAFALGIVVGWLIWARRRPAGSGNSAELAAAKKQLAAAKEQLAEPKERLAATEKRLAATKEQLAAAEEQLAACTCGAEADDDTDSQSTVDDASVVATDQDDAEETAAADEAAEETDVADAPATSDDTEADADSDSDVAALAVAVGALNTAVADEPDDIERIEGIGPKIGKALRAAGLGTYAAIADASPETLREAIQAGGVKFAPSIESWSSQARLLADGDEAGFQDLTDRLVAGRIKG